MMPVALCSDAVHLWTIRLDDPGWERHKAYLDEDEQLRARCYLVPLQRQRFERGHAARRCILGAYLCRSPERIAFEAQPYGKPVLLEEALQFSFSHSHDLALLAVTSSGAGEIGIDIEHTGRRLDNLDGMIAMVCHPSEQAALAHLDDVARLEAFYQLWTRKEAYAKARGLGLRIELDRVYFVPGDSGLSGVRDEASPDAGAFCVRSWRHAPSYLASLCALPGLRIERFDGDACASVERFHFDLRLKLAMNF
jgi:4'-phosphopantetheinyl transferase